MTITLPHIFAAIQPGSNIPLSALDDNFNVLANSYNSIATITNISALRQVSNSINSYYVFGYYSSGDGGGGFFYYNSSDTTSSDNGGTIIIDSINRRWYRSNSGQLNVKWFGAYGNGTTDDTVAMNNAHSLGATVFYPSGKYIFTNLIIPGGGIIGNGASTWLASTTTDSSDCITYTGVGSGFISGDSVPIFKDFNLSTSTLNYTQKNGGCGIRFTPNQTNSENSVLFNGYISNLQIRDIPTSISLNNCSQFSINDCTFFNYSTYGLYLSNNNQPDQGKNTIKGCIFVNSGLTIGTSIFQTNAGGNRISDCFFNAGQYGIILAINIPSGGTTDILIENCGFENLTNVGIQCLQGGTTTTFQNIKITGCEFANNTEDINFDNSGIWGIATISGNVFRNQQINVSSIDIYTCRNLNISSNTIDRQGLGYQSGIGIHLRSGVSQATIGPNSFYGLGTKVQNDSSTVYVIQDNQYGSSYVTTSYTKGSYYAGNGTITFPRYFETNPIMNFTITGGTSPIQIVVTSISTTACNFYVLSQNNNDIVAFTYTAIGSIRSY